MLSVTLENASTVEVNGTTLAYIEHGEGEPVVFVHGGLSDLRTWHLQIPVIGRSYRAITYSRRYARPNADIAPDASDPAEQQADDLATLLHTLDAAPAHVVGNSQGGLIAVITALRHPDVIRSLVLEEPALLTLLGMSVPPRLAEVLRLLLTRHRTALALMSFGARTVAPVTKAFQEGRDEDAYRIFSQAALGKVYYERLPEARKQQMRENLSTLRAGFLDTDDFPKVGAEEVRVLKIPTLLVTGQHSPAIALRLTDVLEEFLPDVERAEIRVASHLMHEENAPAVNEVILGFLGQHAAVRHDVSSA